MNTQDKQLYESAKVWDQSLQRGQKNLAQAIVDFFPNKVITALDVGCGDGKLTQFIIESTGKEIVGLDFSEEALSRCAFKTVHGNATHLPFHDGEFDLVYTTDMLEHLSKNDEIIVWKELFRVAKNWVMVAVPFREELLDATTKCHHCGKLYHVNWHQRSYDWHELVERVPDNYEVDKIVFTGEPWSPYHVIETTFRREILKEISGWREAFCPHCQKPGNDPDIIAAFPSLTGAALGQMIYASLKNNRIFRSHSEILVLYRRKNYSNYQEKIYQQAQSVEGQTNKIAFSDLTIDNNLIPYPQFPHAVHSPNGELISQFPSYEPYHSMQIESGKSCILTLSTEDGLGALYSGELSIEANSLYTLNLPRATVPSYYGILVRFRSHACLKSIQLGKGLPVVQLIPKPQGPASYHFINHDVYPIYIQVTKPCWFDAKSLSKTSSDKIDWMQLFNYMQAMNQDLVLQTDALQAKNQDLMLHIDALHVKNQDLMLQIDALKVKNQNSVLQRDALQAKNQDLVHQTGELEIKNQRLQVQNYEYLSEIYALYNRYEVRAMNKIRKILRLKKSAKV